MNNEQQEMAMINDGYMFYSDYLRVLMRRLEKGKFTEVNLYGRSIASARACIRHVSGEFGFKVKTKTTSDGSLLIVIV